jgi:hypothetical protein
MIIQLNLTRNEVPTKPHFNRVESLKDVWKAYFQDPNFNGLIIHYDWLSNSVVGLAKICSLTGITVKLMDEYLTVSKTILPIQFQPRTDSKGKLPSFSYSASDEHAKVWVVLKKLQEENRKYHFDDMEIEDAKELHQQLKQVQFDKSLALKRLRFLTKKYNLLKSIEHDFNTGESLKRKSATTFEEDITYLSSENIEAQVEALTRLYQLPRPVNQHEGYVNRLHGLYCLANYIDPDMNQLVTTPAKW